MTAAAIPVYKVTGTLRQWNTKELQLLCNPREKGSREKTEFLLWSSRLKKNISLNLYMWKLFKKSYDFVLFLGFVVAVNSYIL